MKALAQVLDHFLKFVGFPLTCAAVEVEINTVGTNEMGVSATS
jgi:hypothetical protein